jgi:hypothetical protein
MEEEIHNKGLSGSFFMQFFSYFRYHTKDNAMDYMYMENRISPSFKKAL